MDFAGVLNMTHGSARFNHVAARLIMLGRNLSAAPMYPLRFWAPALVAGGTRQTTGEISTR
jgi:hypothetical protein